MPHTEQEFPREEGAMDLDSDHDDDMWDFPSATGNSWDREKMSAANAQRESTARPRKRCKYS
jgi:hypothetical protein